MKGETHTYSWRKTRPADRRASTKIRCGDAPDFGSGYRRSQVVERAGGRNILRVNLKAKYSPYAIVSPQHVPSTAMTARSSANARCSLVESLAGIAADPLQRPLGGRARPRLAQFAGAHPVLAAARGYRDRYHDGDAQRPVRQAGGCAGAAGQIVAHASAGDRERRLQGARLRSGERAFVLEGSARALDVSFAATADSPLVNRR